MRPISRSLILGVITWLGVAFTANASNSLSFEGDGYWIDLEIGQTTAPVIASVRFHRPDDPKGVILQRNLLAIEAFDPAHQVLVVRYIGGKNSIGPFTLSVHNSQATLRVDGKRIVSQFNWDM